MNSDGRRSLDFYSLLFNDNLPRSAPYLAGFFDALAMVERLAAITESPYAVDQLIDRINAKGKRFNIIREAGDIDI